MMIDATGVYTIVRRLFALQPLRSKSLFHPDSPAKSAQVVPQRTRTDR